MCLIYKPTMSDSKRKEQIKITHKMLQMEVENGMHLSEHKLCQQGFHLKEKLVHQSVMMQEPGQMDQRGIGNRLRQQKEAL